VTLPDRPKDVIRWKAHLSPEWLQEFGRIAMFSAWVEETLHEIHWRYANLFVDAGVIITGDLSPNRLTEDIIKLIKLNPRQWRRLSDMQLEAHPAVPGWSICSMRVPCAGDQRRTGGDMEWLGRDR
jgi:hypothetical protein